MARDVLLRQISEVLEFDAQNRAQREMLKQRDNHLESLSTVRCEVLDLVLDGQNTKEIAAKLGIGIQTVAKHRARRCRKLGAKSPLEIVRR